MFCRLHSQLKKTKMQEMLTLIFISLCCIIIVLYLMGFIGSGPVTSRVKTKQSSMRERPTSHYDKAELTQRVNRRMRDKRV